MDNSSVWFLMGVMITSGVWWIEQTIRRHYVGTKSAPSRYVIALEVLEEHHNFFDDSEPRICFRTWLKEQIHNIYI